MRRDDGDIFFIGNATTLIRCGGFTVLTDPNFLHKGERVKLGYGLRSTRLTNPAMEIDDLPAIDVVVLSHMHEDHFDRVAEERLDRTVPIVTTRHAAVALASKGFAAPVALSNWESHTLRRDGTLLRITSMPGRHGPGPISMFLPPVMGSMLEWMTEQREILFRMYITGDTLVFSGLREVRDRYPDVDLALVHLGGTKAAGILVTMDGEQGARALEMVMPKLAIPIHYNDYTVFKSPLGDFHMAIEREGLRDMVKYLRHGETFPLALRRTQALTAGVGSR